MAWAIVAGAAISGGVAVYKGAKGASQRKEAERMKLMDPGYQVNRGVIDNAKTVSDFYGNYTLPGYNQMANNINTSFQNSFDSGVQGATSGGDVIDLATRMAYGKNKASSQLDQQSAAGKQGALGLYLQTQAAAGDEYKQKNAWENERYNSLVSAKAALNQAGEENTYGAIDSLAQIGLKTGQSIYSKYYYPDGSPRFDASGKPIPQPGVAA